MGPTREKTSAATATEIFADSDPNKVHLTTRDLVVEILARLEDVERVADYAESVGHKTAGDLFRLQDRVEHGERELHTVQEWIAGHIGETSSRPRPPHEADPAARTLRDAETRVALYGVVVLIAIFTAGYLVGLWAREGAA